MPLLVVSDHLAPELVNQVHLVGAALVWGYSALDLFARFFDRLEVGSPGLPINDFALLYRLDVRETKLVRLCAEGVPRSYLADVLKVSERTLKGLIRPVLLKTGQKRLSGVVWLMRECMPAEALRRQVA